MISVSIVTYHTPLPELDTCMKSLDSADVKRIYIIDNGREGSIAKWATGHKNITYIPNDNRGYGAGHNVALRREMAMDDCRYHLVMNSDLEFSPQTISDIEAFMDSHPDVGTLQPHLFGTDGVRQYTCRRLPTPFDVFVRRFLPKSTFRTKRNQYLLTDLDEHKAWDIPYHQGSFMFLRKDALKDVGMFDERFFMYPEDIDLTRRLHRKYRTIYWPGVSVIHRHKAASYHSIRMLGIHIVNMIRYFNKWGWFFDAERRSFNDGIKDYE